MSSTRSPSRRGPATEVLIVSHGSPSDPDPQEQFIWNLANAVAKSGGVVARGATLAKTDALEDAARGLSDPLVFPHFMADGWFVSTNLPNRLDMTGLSHWRMLPPLGLSPDLPALALRHVTDFMQTMGLVQGETTLILAAHGSPSDPRPARATEAFGKALEASGAFSEVRLGYVDEEPSLEEAAQVAGPALVLPFFAARAGHVLEDLPEGLEAAGFDGPVLPPIGTWEAIPALIVASLRQKDVTV